MDLIGIDDEFYYRGDVDRNSNGYQIYLGYFFRRLYTK